MNQNQKTKIGFVPMENRDNRGKVGTLISQLKRIREPGTHIRHLMNSEVASYCNHHPELAKAFPRGTGFYIWGYKQNPVDRIRIYLVQAEHTYLQSLRKAPGAPKKPAVSQNRFRVLETTPQETTITPQESTETTITTTIETTTVVRKLTFQDFPELSKTKGTSSASTSEPSLTGWAKVAATVTPKPSPKPASRSAIRTKPLLLPMIKPVRSWADSDDEEDSSWDDHMGSYSDNDESQISSYEYYQDMV